MAEPQSLTRRPHDRGHAGHSPSSTAAREKRYRSPAYVGMAPGMRPPATTAYAARSDGVMSSDVQNAGVARHACTAAWGVPCTAKCSWYTARNNAVYHGSRQPQPKKTFKLAAHSPFDSRNGKKNAPPPTSTHVYSLPVRAWCRAGGAAWALAQAVSASAVVAAALTRAAISA